VDDSDDIDNNDSGDDKVIADITTSDGGTCAGLAIAGTVTGDDDVGGGAATADETLLLFSDSDFSFGGGEESSSSSTKATREALLQSCVDGRDCLYLYEGEFQKFRDTVHTDERGESVQAMIDNEYRQWHDVVFARISRHSTGKKGQKVRKRKAKPRPCTGDCPVAGLGNQVPGKSKGGQKGGAVTTTLVVRNSKETSGTVRLGPEPVQ